MYGEIKRIPRKVMEDPRSLIVIPTVFLNKASIMKNCSYFGECIQQYVLSRSLNRYPRSKEAIRTCLKKKNCFLNKNKLNTHVATLAVD